MPLWPVLLGFCILLSSSGFAAVPVDLAMQSRAAIAHIQAGRLTDAQKILSRVPVDAAPHEGILFARALLETRQNHPEAALVAWKALSENFPELPEPHNNLAVLLAAQGDGFGAELALQNAIRANPKYAVAYENLGDVYLARALQHWQKSQALSATPALLDRIKRVQTIQQGIALPVGQVVTLDTPDLSDNDKKIMPLKGGPSIEAADTPSVIEKHERQEQAIQQAVMAHLLVWRDAWAQGDLAAYVAAYEPNYYPSYLESHDAWLTQRKKMLTLDSERHIILNDIVIIPSGDNRAEVVFQQHFSSNVLGETKVLKVMTFIRSGSRWLVRQERVRSQ